MTRFIHDQFAKDYLEELLAPYGEVNAPRRVSGEVREIDVWFAPNSDTTSNLCILGLLGRIAETPVLRVQRQAIDELEALPENNPLRTNTLKLLYNLQKNLEFRQDLDEGDRELIMRLAPLYQQDREQALLQGEQQGIQQGIQQGERLVVNNLLQVRFGSVDEELAAIVEPLLALPPEEFTPMLLQLSREELLARFRESD